MCRYLATKLILHIYIYIYTYICIYYYRVVYYYVALYACASLACPGLAHFISVVSIFIIIIIMCYYVCHYSYHYGKTGEAPNTPWRGRLLLVGRLRQLRLGGHLVRAAARARATDG